MRELMFDKAATQAVENYQSANAVAANFTESFGKG